MSIRGRGPHTVWVQNRVLGRIDGYTDYVNDGVPVKIKSADVQSVREWSTSEEYYDEGLRLLNLARVFTRNWPGDENALIYWDGSEYETVGNPQRMDRTRRTKHWMTTIKWLRAVPATEWAEVTRDRSGDD